MEENNKSVGEKVVKALPWIIGIGVMVYFKGYRSGYKKAIKETADMLIVNFAF